MRILLVANAGHVPTGYGVQTGIFEPLIAQDHELTVFGYFGHDGAPVYDGHGILNVPRLRDPWGNDIVAAHAKQIKADLVLTLVDAFALKPEIYAELPWCAWAPIDSSPATPDNVASLRAARWVWAMSKFGQQQLDRAGITNEYVPLATRGDWFHPVDRAEARDKMATLWDTDLNGKYIVTMNAANKGQPSRKGFYEAFAAFAKVARAHEDAILYCHTDRAGMWAGEDLDAIAGLVNMPKGRVIYPHQYAYNTGMLGHEYLNLMYNAADVYLCTSRGEGFGVPLIEAQAAGCPVIAPEFSTNELIEYGWPLRGGTDFMHMPGALQRLCDVDEAAKALETFWTSTQTGATGRKKAAKIIEKYEAAAVYERHMKPALAAIEWEINHA